MRQKATRLIDKRLLFHQGEKSHLDRGYFRIEMKDRSLLPTLQRLLLVSVAEKRKQSALDTKGGLDHMWDKMFLRFRICIVQRLS